MNPLELEQGSPEWVQARVGSLGASRVADILAKTKTGWGASRANIMAALIAERLTGLPQDTYQNGAMVHGITTEPDARAAYEFRHDVEVHLVGLVPHPSIAGSHASPDGLVGEDGLVEFKCPQTATHIETLVSRSVPGKYVTQVQWQMACTGRSWADYVSYDPRLPESMRLFVARVERDDGAIADLEKTVREFLAELDAKEQALRLLYERPAA